MGRAQFTNRMTTRGKKEKEKTETDAESVPERLKPSGNLFLGTFLCRMQGGSVKKTFSCLRPKTEKCTASMWYA